MGTEGLSLPYVAESGFGIYGSLKDGGPHFAKYRPARERAKTLSQISAGRAKSELNPKWSILFLEE